MIDLNSQMAIAQGCGFVRRYLELDVQEGRSGAEKALEWFTTIEQGVLEYQQTLRNVKQTLG